MEEGEANLPADPPQPNKTNLNRWINHPDYNQSRTFNSTTSSSSSSSFTSSSPPDFLRDVQAAFKRHRPLGTMQSNSIKPRRLLVSQQGPSRNVALTSGTRKAQDELPLNHRARDCNAQTKNAFGVVRETQEDASITRPSLLGTITNVDEDNYKSCDDQKDQPLPDTGCKNDDAVSSLLVESEHGLLVEGQKRVQFAVENNVRAQGADDEMATGTDNLLSHMGSLALTEMECDLSNQVEALTALDQELKHKHFQNLEVDMNLKSDDRNSSFLTKGSAGIQDQLHEFRNFLQGDLNHPMTQPSVLGSTCATTTLINSASAPMVNSVTYCSHPIKNSSSHVSLGFLGDRDMNSQPLAQRDALHPSNPTSKCISGVLAEGANVAAQASTSAAVTQVEFKESELSKEQRNSVIKECDIPDDHPPLDDKSIKGQAFAGDVINPQSQTLLSKNSSSDVNLETSKSGKQEKVVNKAASAPRKRNYDPDLFFKVNGKLYQRLGKIGSGGSSEVHKVISSDCTIYALKKIKLKGRDYATAYGFSQEIEYLNKLKGKNYIIQLVDFEVTDKTLLQEVINGSMSNKDIRVKDDGYIYMVLEYGEIDLAHMLSQKWKELDSSSVTIDENWLRFYWQQILLAVNTIHEERIVHSDLKPANFLLVRGSLKLIDFGIAKAIMSDTTNIQRDSQVGTLSYMSPEAFMCNETDANGNTIKCGRPSDIWSLGCILYQMVYGRTPFSDYKTFWAKFKVITDPKHEITYEPVSNPWLLDLMKKCLAWDRNERWRIPQLLRHPFLVPPIPPQLSFPQGKSCELLQVIAESCPNNRKALMLCTQLQQLLRDHPIPGATSQVSISQDQQCKLLCEISSLCSQLQQQLASLERG